MRRQTYNTSCHLSNVEDLSDHVVVLGHGSLTRALLDKLGECSRYAVVATEPEPELAKRLRDRGYEVKGFESVNEEALRSVSRTRSPSWR